MTLYARDELNSLWVWGFTKQYHFADGAHYCTMGNITLCSFFVWFFWFIILATVSIYGVQLIAVRTSLAHQSVARIRRHELRPTEISGYFLDTIIMHYNRNGIEDFVVIFASCV